MIIAPSNEREEKEIISSERTKMVERLGEEVKAMKRRGNDKKVYCRLVNDQTALVALPGPEQSEWSGGLYTLVVKCEKGMTKIFLNYFFNPFWSKKG